MQKSIMEGKMASENEIVSIDPATLETIGVVALSGRDEIHDKVARARAAFPAWYDLGLKKRRRIMERVQRLLLERKDDFARLITAEMGRPYTESIVMEVEACLDLIDYYVRNANRFLNDRPVRLHNLFFKRRISYLHFQPLGVLAVIAPWNWPLLIPLGVIVPALLSGNAVVFKNSELTPLISEKQRKLFLEAGVPGDVFQVIQGYAETGRTLIDSDVDKIFFTGSTAVGRKIMEQASSSLKKIVLEMGGSDPAIVRKDADLDVTSSGITWGGFNNCGQNCNSIERVYVHEGIAQTLLEQLFEKAGKLRIGPGMDPGTDMGPLASETQLKKIERIVDMAKRNGAECLCGGERVTCRSGYFYQPTILLWPKEIPYPYEQEIFGPVVVITPVRDDGEAIKYANASAYGLCASIWTSDAKAGHRMAHRLEAGTVMINDVLVSFGMPEAGWTGVKKSGIGWVHGVKGLDEMVNIQYINRDPQAKSQKFWWFPYAPSMVRGMEAGLNLLFSNRLSAKVKAAPRAAFSLGGYLLRNKKRKDKI